MPDPTIALLPEAGRAVTAVVEAIAPQAWSRPSPCAGWSVRDVLNHLVAEHLWAPHLLRGETLAQVGSAYDGDLLGADPVAAWRAALGPSMLAWAQAVPDARVHTSMGLLGVVEYAQQMLVDLVVHAWDLAAPAGVRYAPGPDAVEAAIAYERPRVGPAGIAGTFAPPTAYDGDDRLSLLLAVTGRSPGTSLGPGDAG